MPKYYSFQGKSYLFIHLHLLPSAPLLHALLFLPSPPPSTPPQRPRHPENWLIKAPLLAKRTLHSPGTRSVLGTHKHIIIITS